MRGLIVGSGESAGGERFRKEVEQADCIICADGGARYFLRANLYPDILLGDMDSIHPGDLSRMQAAGVEIVRHPPKKNDTDMALAVQLLIEKGADSIRMIGATGTRLDHTLANMSLLVSLAEQGIPVSIADMHNEISALQSGRIQKKGDYLSLLPLDETILVSITGVKYPLDRHTIKRGSSLGVSNEIIAEEALLTVHRGRGLLIQSKDGANEEQ